MQSIRRLYLYAVAFISLETVLWGGIGLARTLIAGGREAANASQLAGALALVLVGAPVFLLHWWLVQRSVQGDLEERADRLRAIFLYALLLATLVPVVQNILALIDRLLLGAFGQSEVQALLGAGQSTADNLVGAAVNALAAAYFFWVLRSDWRRLQPAVPIDEAGEPVAYSRDGDFAVIRRIYRYLWLLYGLGLGVLGLQQILRFFLTALEGSDAFDQAGLANGVALLLVATPVWLLSSQAIQRSLIDPEERESLLRLAVLYGLVFTAVAIVLTMGGLVLEAVFRTLLGHSLSLQALLGELADPLAIALPFGAVWAYYGRLLAPEMALPPEPPPPVGFSARLAAEALPVPQDSVQARRDSLRRLYFYGLSFLGLATAFTGLQLLTAFILDLAITSNILGVTALRTRLAAALASLAVGLPLWYMCWRPVLREAAREGETGDYARRSVVRKGYLFTVLFLGVIGLMAGGGLMLYQLLRAALGDAPPNLPLEVLQGLKTLLLFALLVAYHGQALRQDTTLAERALARRHALFPVLVLSPGESGPGEDGGGAELDPFAYHVVHALQRQAPSMPVAVHPFARGAPDESLSTARAVILPSELVARPTEAMRLWLQAFSGPRVVIPTPAQGWFWVFGGGRSPQSLARQAAITIRRLAEGQAEPSLREASPLMLLAYALVGLFALLVVAIAVNFIATLALP